MSSVDYSLSWSLLQSAEPLLVLLRTCTLALHGEKLSPEGARATQLAYVYPLKHSGDPVD